MLVALVEGSTRTAVAVRQALDSHHLIRVKRLTAATALAKERPVELIVVAWPDRGMPAGPWAEALDEACEQAPLLAVVAPHLVADRRALTASGVRYVPLPVDADELRRLADAMADPASADAWLGDIHLDRRQRRVTRAGHPVELTRREFDLLDHLARNQRIVRSKEQLLEHVWGSALYSENVVEVTVSSLRRKLEAYGPRVIETVRGVGYVCRAAHNGDQDHAMDLMARRQRLIADRDRLLARRDALLAR